MINPESVHSPDLLLFDTILDDMLRARQNLALLRARQFTRDYDRQRKAAIAAGRKPTPLAKPNRPPAVTDERIAG